MMVLQMCNSSLSMATTVRSVRTRGALTGELPPDIEPYFGCDLCSFRNVPITNPDVLQKGHGVEQCPECGTRHWVTFEILPPDGWCSSSEPLKPTKLTLLMET